VAGPDATATVGLIASAVSNANDDAEHDATDDDDAEHDATDDDAEHDVTDDDDAEHDVTNDDVEHDAIAVTAMPSPRLCSNSSYHSCSTQQPWQSHPCSYINPLLVLHSR